MQHVASCLDRTRSAARELFAHSQPTAEVHSTAMQIFDAVEHMAIYFVKDRLLKVLLKLAVQQAAKMCQDYSNQQSTHVEAEASPAMFTYELSCRLARFSQSCSYVSLRLKGANELGHELQDEGRTRFSHEVRLLAKAAIDNCGNRSFLSF